MNFKDTLAFLFVMLPPWKTLELWISPERDREWCLELSSYTEWVEDRGPEIPRTLNLATYGGRITIRVFEWSITPEEPRSWQEQSAWDLFSFRRQEGGYVDPKRTHTVGWETSHVDFAAGPDVSSSTYVSEEYVRRMHQNSEEAIRRVLEQMTRGFVDFGFVAGSASESLRRFKEELEKYQKSKDKEENNDGENNVDDD